MGESKQYDILDEEDQGRLGYVSSSDHFSHFDEMVDTDWTGIREKFGNQNVESFPDSRIHFSDHFGRHKAIIDCLLKGFSFSLTRKIVGCTYYSVLTAVDKYKFDHPQFRFMCRCGVEMPHKRRCSFAYNYSGFLQRNGPKVFNKDEVRSIVLWYKQGKGYNRIADHFNVGGCRIRRLLIKSGVKIKRSRAAGKEWHPEIPRRVRVIYHGILHRCYDKSSISWSYYGGRGIRMCESWRKSVVNFFADMGSPPTGFSIDRIDNARDYEPSNCRWANASMQTQNRGDSPLLHDELDPSLRRCQRYVYGDTLCSFRGSINLHGRFYCKRHALKLVARIRDLREGRRRRNETGNQNSLSETRSCS